MGTLGWILVGVGILVANGLFWILLYQREVGALIRRISRLEHRLVNQGGALPLTDESRFGAEVRER